MLNLDMIRAPASSRRAAFVFTVQALVGTAGDRVLPVSARHGEAAPSWLS